MTTSTGIYEIRNKKTGHCYIGSSINLPERKWKHFSNLRNGKHHSQYLQRAFNKWGKDAFEFLVIEEVSDVTMLVQREQYWIEQRHPQYNMNPLATNRLGVETSEETRAKLREYNLRPEVVAKKSADMLGHEVTLETRAKIKAARAKQVTTEKAKAVLLAAAKRTKAEGRTPRERGKNSDEQNRKIGEAHKGRRAKPETIEKMRNAKLGKKQSPEVIANRAEGMLGHEVSEETRIRIAESNRLAWARKSPEEKHALATNRPPVSDEARQHLRDSHLGKKPTPQALANKHAAWEAKSDEDKARTAEKRRATWASKSQEEYALIADKKRATRAAKRNKAN